MSDKFALGRNSVKSETAKKKIFSKEMLQEIVQQLRSKNRSKKNQKKEKNPEPWTLRSHSALPASYLFYFSMIQDAGEHVTGYRKRPTKQSSALSSHMHTTQVRKTHPPTAAITLSKRWPSLLPTF